MSKQIDIATLDGALYDAAVEALMDDEAEALAWAMSELLDRDAIAAMIAGRRSAEEVKEELRDQFKTWLQQYRQPRISTKARAIAIMRARPHHTRGTKQ